MAWNDLSLPMDDSDFFVRVVPFDRIKGVILTDKQPHAVVTENPDGTYNLYIDANAPYAEQVRVYWHEYEHLAYDDFGSGKALRDIEEGL